MKETMCNNLSLLYAYTIDILYTCTLWRHFIWSKLGNPYLMENVWIVQTECFSLGLQNKAQKTIFNKIISVLLHISMLAHYLQTHASFWEKNHILQHFRLYYSNIAFSEMVPRWDERLQNMSGKGKKLRKAGGERLKRSTACKWTNTGGAVFYSLQQIEAAERDGATIWPQLRAAHCKSTKINGNNSTLDAHHYPDGVLGELHRPPNQEQTQTESAALKYHRPPRWFSLVCLC